MALLYLPLSPSLSLPFIFFPPSTSSSLPLPCVFHPSHPLFSFLHPLLLFFFSLLSSSSLLFSLLSSSSIPLPSFPFLLFSFLHLRLLFLLFYHLSSSISSYILYLPFFTSLPPTCCLSFLPPVSVSLSSFFSFLFKHFYFFPFSSLISFFLTFFSVFLHSFPISLPSSHFYNFLPIIFFALFVYFLSSFPHLHSLLIFSFLVSSSSTLMLLFPILLYAFSFLWFLFFLFCSLIFPFFLSYTVIPFFPLIYFLSCLHSFPSLKENLSVSYYLSPFSLLFLISLHCSFLFSFPPLPLSSFPPFLLFSFPILYVLSCKHFFISLPFTLSPFSSLTFPSWCYPLLPPLSSLLPFSLSS